VSDHLERLDRLGQLRARGDITDAEFEAQKAAILAAEPAGRKRTGVIGAIVAATVLVLVAGVYLLARLHGTEDALSEASHQSAPQPTTISRAASDPATTPKTEGAADAASPPSEYLRLCVFSGSTATGMRLGTLSDFAAKLGRKVSWEPNGADWILRMSWRDQLSGVDHDEAFQFTRRADARPTARCDGPLGDVSLDRMVLDSLETKAFDPALVPAFYKDSSTPNLSNPASSTPALAQTAGSAPALKSGRCRLVVGGQSYIDGTCFFSLDKDGSFSIYDTPDGTGGYFATLERDGSSGAGYWNGSKGSTHAQDELGAMSRDKACWSNGSNQICLWS